MSKVLNQKEGVYQATMTVLSDLGLDFDAGMDVRSFSQIKEIRSKVAMIVVAGLAAGTITCDASFDEAGLKKYVPGLVNNWYRKDTRLNGGSKYETQNPGSRAGTGNVQVKELKKLYAAQKAANVDEEMLSAIQEAIDSQIAASKTTKEVKIDFSKIPSHLIETLGIKLS